MPNVWYGEQRLKEINQMLFDKMTLASEFVKDEAVRRVPKDTRNLEKSITKEVITESGEVVGRIGTNVIYAAIQEFGGVIKAKVKDYLTFQTKDGKWHKAKEVTIKAQPYLRPALLENKQKITNFFEK